ncbi:aldehyde dehydrogenase [Rhodococcoides fascians]|uniref:aldehyde dehydrogenase family protein n=1 Tax=Nocardiaceae TaxID=85025 RepID=UPI000B9B6A41|nr:aldehyde dehydrogenase family protein [Rhodococcus fascians]OZE85335.1 aldehyde dehydrogenase [Rhodococcus fascians]OZF11842.1 aldehyde dehydrogenase [Rhodococcus fascians]OZF14611.1 aldehyde dehydrogenase [Rhodococcus fascians]OZF71386.1 aldehyde dehydrogenase [Rhodococcus fascians]OZF72858.1 aldehyde dehydrogenase [Rhodococcus fascians]
MSVSVPLHNLIGGQWRAGSGEALTSISPADPAVVVAVGTLVGQAELDKAVAAAQGAKKAWARTPAHERGAVLVSAAAIVEDSAREWGAELALEEGKTKAEGVGEVLRAAQILRYYGNDADRTAGEVFSSPRRGERILVTRKPIGVVGVITPFNFPIAIPTWKIAPALTYGNTVVWKPASTVPLLAMRLAQALHRAGLPAGVLNLLLGDGRLGGAIVDHAGIDAVTFTGSTGVGRAISTAAAARGTAVQAEMGGKNAAIVLADADLELAAEQVMFGAFRSTGQKCTATSRLVVAQEVADEFVAVLGKRADALAVGDPLDDAVEMGPVVNAAARSSIQAGIDRAVEQGARHVTGAWQYGEGTLASGYFVPPTILELASHTTDIWREELFGPVLAVRRATSVENAFELANEGELGLSAAVFTQDLTRALDAVDEIDVGILHINSESAGADPHVPFGGAKKSGYGPKEQGQSAREFFTHTTTVYLRGGQGRI